MDAATAKLASLDMSKTGPGGKPVVNAAVVGEWDDAKAAYTGPKLSRRMWENEHFAKSEGLDYVFRTSECARRRPAEPPRQRETWARR